MKSLERRIILGALAAPFVAMSPPAWSECPQIPTSRYVIKGAEVFDTQTGLTWARCSVGQVWTEGAGCVGKIRTLTFEQAKQQVDATWRLPTFRELLSLIAYCQHPVYNTEVFPNMDVLRTPVYWGDANENSEFPPLVDFEIGGSSAYSRKFHFAVRLVRK